MTIPKSFTIEEFQYAQFEDFSKKLGIKISALVRLAMEILAKRLEDGATPKGL